MSAQNIAQRDDFIFSKDDAYFWHPFGLDRNPFPMTPGHNAYYPFHQFEESLDLLQQLSRNNNILLAVVGPKGAGKSTLMHQFLVQTVHDFDASEVATYSKLAPGEFWVLLEETLRTCQVRAGISLDPERLIDLMTEGFDLPWQSTDTLHQQIDAQIDNLRRCKQTCLLLIDDAHLLPDETLQALLYMINQQSESEMRFHVILFGNSTLKAQLSKISDKQKMADAICLLDVKPLTREETECYLQHCFGEAGLKGTMPLSHAQIQRIYRQSKGIPGQINQVAQQLLLAATRRKPHVSVMEWVQEHAPIVWGTGLFVLTAICLAIFMNNNSMDMESDSLVSSSTSSTYHSSSQESLYKIASQTASIDSTPHTVTATAPGIKPIAKVAPIVPATHPASVPLSVSIINAEQAVLQSNRYPVGGNNTNANGVPDHIAPIIPVSHSAATSIPVHYSSVPIPGQAVVMNPLPQVKQPPVLQKQLALSNEQIVSLQAKAPNLNSDKLNKPIALSTPSTPDKTIFNPLSTVALPPVQNTMAIVPPSLPAKATPVIAPVSNVIVSTVPSKVVISAVSVPLVNAPVARSVAAPLEKSIVIGQANSTAIKPMIAVVNKSNTGVILKTDEPTTVVSTPIASKSLANAVTKEVISKETMPIAPLVPAKPIVVQPSIVKPVNANTAKQPTVSIAHKAVRKDHHVIVAGHPSKVAKQLLATNPQSYTLQLVGVSYETALQKLMKEQPLGVNAKYFHTRRDGKDWYVLVYGVYATPQQAAAAKAHLPSSIQAMKPWVRRMASVHQAIKNQ